MASLCMITAGTLAIELGGVALITASFYLCDRKS